MKPHDVIPRDLDSPGPEESAVSAAGGFLVARQDEAPRNDKASVFGSASRPRGLLLALLAFGFASCQPKAARPTIGVAFETLQTEFWVAAIDALRADLAGAATRCWRRSPTATPTASSSRSGRSSPVGSTASCWCRRTRRGSSPRSRAANEAGIPIVLFNRPADPTEARSVAVVADNLGIARATVEHLCALARQSGRRQKAAILIGDLGDVNAIGRRDGFDQAAAACADAIEVVARIPTEWNQEKALAGRHQRAPGPPRPRPRLHLVRLPAALDRLRPEGREPLPRRRARPAT